MPATKEEFIEFFEQKKKGVYLCPVCSSHEFSINVAEPAGADISNAPPAVLIVPTSRAGAHNFYSLSCANCGHTTFFHTHQFDAWKEKKAGGGQ